jgi:hypothetical protein
LRFLRHDIACEFGDVRLKAGKWLPRHGIDLKVSVVDRRLSRKVRPSQPQIGLSLGPIPIGQGMFCHAALSFDRLFKDGEGISR